MACDVNALLRDAAGFQGLSEREQWAAIAQLLCDISQRGPSWAAVFPDGSAVGPNGIIDTSGTTTCGIQEAINSLPTTNLTTRYAGGGKIIFTKGVYNCTGTITIPNQGAYNLIWEGCGKTATLIKYTGSASKFIQTAVDTVATVGFSSLQMGMKSLGVTAVNSAPQTTLVWLGALNEAIIDDVLICPDECLAGGGACLNYVPAAGINGVEGLRTIGCNQVRLINSAIWDCARGATLLSDHVRVENTFFEVTDAQSNYSFSTDGNNYYPKSYCLMLGVSGFEGVVNGCHFAESTVALYAARIVQHNNPLFETCAITTLIDATNGGAVVVSDPCGNSPADITDKQIDNAGVITALTPTSTGSVETRFSQNSIIGITTDLVVSCGTIQWTRPIIKQVSGGDATTTGQSLTDITGLTFGTEQGATYEFEACLMVSTSADVTGCEYGVSHVHGVLNTVGGATLESGLNGSLTSTASASERITALNTASTNSYLTTSGQSGQVIIKGVFTVTTGGTFSIRHLKTTSGTSTVRIGSFLKVTRIS